MFTARKIRLLGAALVFKVCKVFCRRQSNIWVFGALSGKKYDDNAKYLFEYVNNNFKDSIHTVWLAKNEKVVDDVRNNGGEAYTFESKQGKVIARKAGVAIYTHSLEDFGHWPQVGGAMLVYLGHGVGFKKTCNAKRKGIALVFKKLLDKLFSWIQRDITIATSSYNQLQRKNIAGLKDCSRIFITGQPRNDVFKKGIDRNGILDEIGIDNSKKIILYMPTYRKLVAGKDNMTDIIQSLYQNSHLAEILDQGNYVFIAKLHPMTQHIDIKPRDNFLILDYSAVKSNQELLAIGDILITDFSSCCVDFALLRRPIIFFVPDKDWFVKYSEPVCDEFYEISAKNQCINADNLAEKIKMPSLDATNAINDLYEDGSIRGTNYCENVYKAICREII